MSHRIPATTPALFALLGMLAAAPSAQAAFVMTLDDPFDSFAAVSLQDDDSDGVITFSGAVGNFLVNVTTGISKPLIGPAELDLNSINVSGAAGTLLVTISDTDFTGNLSAFNASYGGTTEGTVDFDFLYDTGNQAFGGSAFASDHFVSSTGKSAFSSDQMGTVIPASPYALTISARLTHDSAFEVSSFDAHITPVPLPASLWLLGSALAGLAALRKRRT